VAFIGIDLKQQTAVRSAAGIKGQRLPTTTLDELRVRLPGCESIAEESAPAWALGYRVPAGTDVTSILPEENRMTAEDAVLLRSLLWWTHSAANGVLDEPYLYNLGSGANNVFQVARVEVLEVDGRRARVHGRHPGLYVYGNSRQNPNWPGVRVDPDTLEVTPEPRLISDNEEGCLMLGAKAAPVYPSVLYRKLQPALVKVESPTVAGDLDNCTFWIELSHSVEHLMEPFDLALPPFDGRYYLDLVFYFTAPESHPNYQPSVTAHWERMSVELAEFPAELLNSAGESTRVLPPDLVSEAGPAMLAFVSTAGGASILQGAALMEYLEFTDTGAGWETRVDLSAIGATSATIIYWAEAAAGTMDCAWGAGACANSQVDLTGGFVHDVATGRRCTNVDCSKFAGGGFRGICWDPSATGFCLQQGAAGAGYQLGRLGMPRTHVAESQWISRSWCDTSVIIEQGMAGVSSHRNFSFARIGGPSLLELLGGFWNGPAPGGNFPRREPVHSPAFGRRETYTDEEGTHQRLAFGAFIADAEQDLSSRTRESGTLALVDGWEGRDDDHGAAPDTPVRGYPLGNVGNSHGHNFGHGGNGMMYRSRVSDSTEELHLTAANLSQPEDAAVTAEVRGW
jgi:hypothetical protein